MGATVAAMFGLGDFWQAEDFFHDVKGVVETEVGYSGGTSTRPTHEAIGDHTEVLHLEFDPSVVSFEELLRLFWQQHDPTALFEQRYRSVIFYFTEEQRRAAEASLKEHQLLIEEPVATVIEPAGRFYPAEAGQQRYYARLRGEV